MSQSQLAGANEGLGMSKVIVAAFSISLDGFGAGFRQDLNNPLGVRGFELHGWLQNTEVFKKNHRAFR